MMPPSYGASQAGKHPAYIAGQDTDDEEKMPMTIATVDAAHKPTILIVDDIPNNLGVVVETLENTYRLVVALDGDEGLQRAAFIKPDLILLGVMIPGMDGFEVCRRLKQNPDTADIPVIFLTTLTGAEHKVTGFKAGGVDYLTKPIQVDEVIARIGAHLGMRLMRRQLQAQNRQLQRQQAELEQRVAELNASNRLLREEIEERERVLEFIAQRAWLAEGGVFLTELARYLGQLLSVDYVLVDKLAADPGYAETVALYARGEVLPNLQYSLEHTPCENVMAGGLCCYPAQVQQRFPKDTLLADMQVESYIGLPLWDSLGRVIGLIAVMDDKPMLDERAVTFLLQRVATSAAAELERRRSEQLLEESRQFLSRMIETIPDPVFVKDRQHRWVLLNPAFCEFIGYPPSDLLGKADSDFFARHEAGVFQAKDEVVFTSGEECVNEEEFTGRDGKTRTIVTKKSRYIDDLGDAYWVGIIQDITERKAAEWRISHVLSSLPGFIYSFRMAPDGHCSFPFASRGIEDIYGLTPDDVKDDMAPLHALTHPDDAPRVIAAIAESAQMLAPFRIEVRVLRPGRPELWVECRSLPERDSDGGIIWHGLMLDITERKRAEMENRRLISILEESADFIGSADMQGNLLYHNPAARHMVGLPDDADMSRMHVADMHPEWAAKQVRETMLPAVLEHGVWRGDSSLRHRDGREIPVAQLLILHRDAEGRPEFMSTIMQDLTEHKRIQSRLELVERAIDLSSDTILLIDEHLRFTYVNEAACRSLGYRREELLGMTPPDIDPDVTHEMVLAMLQTTFKNGSLPVFESRQRARDGRIFPVEISASLVEYGGAQFSLAVVRDITQRKQMETTLRRREAEFRALAESSPDPIIRYDRDCRRIYVNPAFERLSGKPAAELLNSAPFDTSVLGAREGGKLQRAIRQVLETGRVVDSELEFIMPDGRRHYFHIRNAPELDTQGDVASVISIAYDITERKVAEALLCQREREFRTLAEGLPDPVCRYDGKLRRIYVNPAWERVNRMPAAEVLGKTIAEANSKISAAIMVYQEHLESVLASGEPVEWEMVLDQLDPVQYHLVSFVPERDDNGDITEILAIERDISALRRSEMAIRRSERELRTLVENLPTMVVRYDRNFQRVYVNRAYSLITGRSESEILGKSAEDAWRATNISAESYIAVLGSVMRNGRKSEVSLEWIDANARLISHEIKIVPEFDTDGQVSSVLALGFDLSDRRHRQIIEGERQRVFEKMAHGDNLDSILEQVGVYVEASKIGGSCCILLLDEAGKHLQTVAAPSFPESYLGKLKPLLLNDESNRCCGWVASALRSERVILEDIGEHPCRVNCQAFIREIGAVACWSEPIFSSSGQLLGVLTLYISQGGAPDHDDLALLMQASHLSSIAIERKRIEQQMYRQASYDALTGLPNRRLFSDRLREEIAKAERGAYRVALLFIDLDRFKEVNDSLGHEAGDLLLVEAAQRIRARVRESDTVARLGGDEFIVILPEVGDIFPQDRVAQDLVEAMERPFRLGKHDVFVSASIGIAGYPQDAGNAETLSACADQAMYAAKDMGRSGFSFFTRSMQEQAQQRLQVAAELRGALGKGQLEVYYQPIIEVASGRVVKAEALLRWRHPELGMVSPDKFIPIAEETGLIQEIGAWVFGEAADTAKRWNALCKSGGIRQVSVNMSPRQFVRGNPDTVCIEYLQAIDLNPKAMVIEITEGLLLDDQAEVMNKLRRFHEAGMQLALDDFGTGYSAMGYLKKFNIDYLKIDRSFIRDIETDPGDRTITEAIVVMAHRLGLKVIAEGVETEGQRELLAAVRCEYVQGYLYARPMPLEAFLDYAAGNAVSPS